MDHDQVSADQLLSAAKETIERLDPAAGVLAGGEWSAGLRGVLEVEDPASLEIVAHVADGGVEDAVRAVDGADAAFSSWSRMAPRLRAEILVRGYDLMIERREVLAALISLENGKSLADARSEVTYAAEFLRWYAEESVRPHGDYGSAPDGGARTVVSHRPVGIAALVTPWNFPAAMVTRKIAPALAAGCTVVLKPASETPLTAFALVRILMEAGLPDGVVNLVPSNDPGGVVSTWLADPRVRKVSFTGSTGVGKVILRQAAERVVNASMELGGNAPFIVAAGADVDAAVAGAMIAKFRGGGQACTAANRLYVHVDLAQEFVDRLGQRVRELTVGPAFTGAEIGPLISAKAVDGVDRLVRSALDSGAQIVAEGGACDDKGHFFTPVLLGEVPPDCDVVQKEIFGPVAPVVYWSDEEELINQVNGTEAGLAAYVYSGDIGDALQIGERIEAGMVGINRGIVSDPSAPFGGVRQSGLGREGAREGLHAFLEPQYFSIAWPAS